MYCPIARPVCAVLALGWLILGSGDGRVLAGGGPENVFVVVNARESTSLGVANWFVHLRQIPPENVLYLDGIPTRRLCTWEVFRDRIGDPVIKAIEDRKLTDHIDYIVFSTNFPTAVKCDEHLERLKEQVRLPDDRMFNPVVSTNSLMTFYLYAARDDPSWLGLDANWYFAPASGDVLKQPFLGKTAERYQAGLDAMDASQFDEAIALFSDLAEAHPQQVAGHYQLARALAQAGRSDESLLALKRARAVGWRYRKFTNDDPWLQPLQDNADFQQMLRRIPNAEYGKVPTRGFSSQVVWGRNGWPNRSPDQGKRLILSTMLGVTGGERGNTRAQIVEQLQRSAEADGTAPQGTFYFSRTRDVRTRTRQDQFADAMRDLKRLGFQASEIQTVVPENRDNVLGATLGSAQVDWLQSGSRFLPGALCDNLTSVGGAMQDQKTQTPVTDYLKFGAAGASGTVIEPYAVAPKFPSARLHVHYARGCNLAEAFYQSVAGPFQLLIVGDPLCQPWARFPEFAVGGLQPDETVKGTIDLDLEVDSEGPAVSRFELFLDGRRLASVPASRKTVSLTTSDLSDGWHELRVVAIDNTLIGTRASRSIGFNVDHQGHEVELELAGTGEYDQNRSLILNARSNVGDRISILQNSRLVGEIEGQAGELRIDCFELGVGPSSLVARVTTADGDVRSRPVPITIRP